MTAWLKTQGDAVNPQRVARRLRVLGVEAHLSQAVHAPANPWAAIYPCLLRGRSMRGVQPVWSTAITFIRRRSGCMSLVAVLAWCSRSVVAWAVALTRQGGFCVEAWARASRGRPARALYHSDRGARFTSREFTSREFTSRLEAAGMQMSMDGRGRALDHIVGERLCGEASHRRRSLGTMMRRPQRR